MNSIFFKLISIIEDKNSLNEKTKINIISLIDNIINDKEKDKYIQDLKETLSKTTDAELQEISATL